MSGHRFAPFPRGPGDASIANWSIEEAWSVVSDLYMDQFHSPKTTSARNLEDELLFCLLGGFGVTFEHGRSAAAIVAGLSPFSECWNSVELFEEIVRALRTPQFEPKRTDGSLRRYRFPRRKASAILKARRWMLDNAISIEQLSRMKCARDRRQLLCKCPGVGLKTASWLLRNLGIGADLAIVDVHVARALVTSGRMPETLQLPRDYELAEAAFLEWCNELHAPPAGFDLFVWDWQRGSLRPG